MRVAPGWHPAAMEPALDWRKASACTSSGNCVEIARDGPDTLVRDGKNPDGPRLRFDPAEWAAFLEGVRRGEFGPPTVGS